MAAVVLWKPSMRIETKSVLVILMALIFNRIYSTQFHLWFYPMVIFLLAMEKNAQAFRTLFVSLLVLDVLNVLVYPFTFSQAVHEMGGLGTNLAAEKGQWGTVLFSSLIVIRAMFLVWFFALMVRLEKNSVSPSVV